MMISRPALVFGFFIAVATAIPAASLNEFIAVTANASPGYARPADQEGRVRPESYVFTQGKFLEGSTRDDGLARVSFNDVVRTLAPGLAKQNYFPTRDVASANLLIVVSWGSTVVENNPQRDRMIESLSGELKTYTNSIDASGHADTGPLNEMSDFFQWTGENSDRAFAQNAFLLGYAGDLKKVSAGMGLRTEQESAMRRELGEERYFVVLMAYDNQTFRREKRPKLLWTTRLSVRSPGNAFVEALPVLGQAGSHVFGRQMAGLEHLPANLREGRVSISPLKYLGVSEEAEPPAKTQ